MNASFTNTLIGEAGVTVRAEKEGVNDLDHRISPPRSQLIHHCTSHTYPDVIWTRDLALCLGI